MPDKDTQSPVKTSGPRKASPEPKRSKPIQVIAITSGKGGVGKTSIATNLGAALAASGRRTLLLDADLGLANVDVMLGLHAEKNLAGVIRGEWALRDILITGPNGLLIAPASSGVKHMVQLSAGEHAGIINAFSELADDIDVMLIDTSGGISANVTVYARAAQEVVVVVCDEPASIADAYALIKILNRDYGVVRFRILANRVESEEHGKRLYGQLLKVIDRFLSLTPEYMGAVPEDQYLRQSLMRQQPVVDAYPLSASASSFKNLSRDLSRWERPASASGYLEFFVEHLSHHSQTSSVLEQTP